MGRDNIHLEKNFENYISKKLATLESSEGWRVSPDDTGFDPDTALYMPDFIEYLTAVSPDKVKKIIIRLIFNSIYIGHEIAITEKTF